MNSRRLISHPRADILSPGAAAYLDGQSRARPLELAGNEPLLLNTRAQAQPGGSVPNQQLHHKVRGRSANLIEGMLPTIVVHPSNDGIGVETS